MRQVQKERHPLHILTVLQLGTETKIRNHELTATAYLKKIMMRCTEIKGKSSRKVVFSQYSVCSRLGQQEDSMVKNKNNWWG